MLMITKIIIHQLSKYFLIFFPITFIGWSIIINSFWIEILKLWFNVTVA